MMLLSSLASHEARLQTMLAGIIAGALRQQAQTVILIESMGR